MLKQIWKDFSDFWKSQVFWAALLTGITAFIQWRKGAFSGSIRANVLELCLPYGGIILVFILGNVGRTFLKKERDAARKKRREERREEHRAEMTEHRAKVVADEKASAVPPNLKFRRVFPGKVFVGHEMTGNSYNAWFTEIGNELSDREIGYAKEIRAHITYLDGKGNVLQTLCPSRWGTYQPEPEANIRQGEGCLLILAYDKGHWFSDLSDGIRLPEKSRIKVRLIDADGKDVLNETLIFEFRTQGLVSDCKRL